MIKKPEESHMTYGYKNEELLCGYNSTDKKGRVRTLRGTVGKLKSAPLHFSAGVNITSYEGVSSVVL